MVYTELYTVSWYGLFHGATIVGSCFFFGGLYHLIHFKKKKFGSPAEKKFFRAFILTLTILGFVVGIMTPIKVTQSKLRYSDGDYKTLESPLVKIKATGTISVLHFEDEKIGVGTSGNACFPGDDTVAQTFKVEVGAIYRVKYFKYGRDDDYGCILQLHKKIK
ncbi:hypothetical protein [Pleionea mediterranea]|uniref:Uncharacterized protein n=1 Tax=Pleionea mediterranea TaxID=523701 RepID=A0A316FSR8_9GAMM|nr:hypothetical protein [Pleionea mediterranea]PWK51734.1 hypothetical protein C8D97_10549 [Pleionea mediterranea]